MMDTQTENAFKSITDYRNKPTSDEQLALEIQKRTKELARIKEANAQPKKRNAIHCMPPRGIGKKNKEPKIRTICLKCQKWFMADHEFNRRCDKCKNQD